MEKENRCWPGYEPVPGKKPHSQGSCKPKAESKNSPSEKEFRAKRRKQLDQKQAEHPGSRRQSLQHLGPPGGTKQAVAKKKSEAAAKKASGAPKKRSKAKNAPSGNSKAPAKKSSPSRTTAKKNTSKKSAATTKGAKKSTVTRKAA